ncbi:hypothetical protein Q8A73_002085 [Channa argus]|nr:hypothetical protein Q8A73_002085 [Channa argus]
MSAEKGKVTNTDQESVGQFWSAGGRSTGIREVSDNRGVNVDVKSPKRERQDNQGDGDRWEQARWWEAGRDAEQVSGRDGKTRLVIQTERQADGNHWQRVDQDPGR